MIEQMGQIIEQGQMLADKRTWLSKGYADLIAAINVELAKIPDMGESDIEYLLKGWDHAENDCAPALHRKLTIDLRFSGDAYLVMSRGKQDYDGRYSWDNIDNPSIDSIRLFAGKITEMFDYFEKEITKRNTDNQAAIDIIGGLIAKIKEVV